MKRTSEELLDFYGLKVGDIVHASDFLNYEVKHSGVYAYLYCINNGMESTLNTLFGLEYRVVKKQHILTEDEKVILRNLPEEYKWIVRDDCVNALYVHATFPRRYEDIYMSGGVCQRMELFEHLFKFITWEDEPYEISELLNV